MNTLCDGKKTPKVTLHTYIQWLSCKSLQVSLPAHDLNAEKDQHCGQEATTSENIEAALGTVGR